MVSLNPSIDSLRLDGHIVDTYFGVFTPDVIYESTILSGASDKTLTLSVDTGTGDITDCLPGYTVRVFTSGGVFKGETNIRAGATASAGVLPIRELGQSDIQTNTGDIVRVYNQPFLGDKLPRDNATFAPDNVTYTDQGENYRPNVMSGGHVMRKTDPGETFATVEMAGAGSDVTDPTSTPGNVTHLWELLTSTLAFQSGSVDSDADPVIEADVGYGLAKHTVTDDDNSESWSQFVMFQIYDGSDPDVVPGYPLISCTLNGEELLGWTGDIEVQGAIPKTEVFDGSLCVIWTEEYVRSAVNEAYYATIPYGGTGGLYSDRGNIKFIGYLTRDEGDITDPDAPSYRTRFNLRSPLAQLATLPGWTKVFTRTASPTDWTGLKGLTVKLAMYHLLKHYSWYTEIFEVHFDADFLDKDFSQFYLDKLTADAQLTELAKGVDGKIVNLRTGELLIYTHQSLIYLNDRASVPKLATLTNADVLVGSTFNRDHWKTIQTFELRAFEAGAVQERVFYARFPGNTPGRGNQVQVVEKAIADDAVDAMERCGRHAAMVDGTVMTTLTGSYERAVEWNVPLRGYYDGLDFHKAYINTTLTGTCNGRAVDLSLHLFYLARISVTYNANGTSDVQATLRSATNAGWGANWIPPVAVPPPYTPPDLIPPPYFPPSNPTRLPVWDGIDQEPTRMFILSSEGAEAGIARAWSPSALSLTYEDISTSLGGNGIWATANPYDYRMRLALTDTGLYRAANIWSFSSWSQIGDNDAIFTDPSYVGQKIEPSINRRGYYALSSGANAFVYTTDDGANWNRVGVGGAASYGTGPAGASYMRFAVSPHNSSIGRVYALVFVSGTYLWQLYKSDNWGATWATVGSTINMLSNYADLNVPYMRSDGSTLNINDSSQEIYLQGGGISGGGLILQSTDAGASFTTKAATSLAPQSHVPVGSTGGRALQTFTYNGSVLLSVTRQIGAGADDSGVRTSDDSGATAFSATSPLFNSGALQTSLNGYAAHSGAVVAWCRAAAGTNNNVIRWSLDLGTTWASVATPSFFSGNRHVAYCEWDLSDLVSPG